MFGMIMTAGLGVLQGLDTIKQGKQITKVGRDIKRAYESLNDKKGDLKARETLGKETAKNIKKEQEEQAKSQYEFNRNEIKRALEINMRGLIAQHISLKDNLNKELTDIKGKLAFAFDKKNVEESSIKDDSMNKLRNEALEKANILIENQMQDMEELGNQSSFQLYQNDLQLNKTKEGINQNYLVSLSNSELQLQRDLNQLQNFIHSGVGQGQQYIQQGMNIKGVGGDVIGSAVLGFGKGVFNKIGGIDGIMDKFSKKPMSYGKLIGEL